MATGTYALIDLETYKSWARIGSAELEADALSIYSDDGSAATVAKSGNTLTLAKTGGTGTGHAIDLTLAANDTLGELAAVINAYAGWTANLEGWASAPSIDLENFSAVNCLLVNNEQTLIFYENYILERLIDRGSSIIESFLRRNIKSRAYVNERYDGGGDEIFLKNYPVTLLVHVCNCVEDVIQVRCTSTTARHAYVAVDAVGQTVKMIRDGTVDGNYDLSAMLTMTALATAMNAISGWDATVINSLFNAWLTSDLFSHPSRYCLGEYTELQVPAEPLAGLEVDMGAGIIKIPSSEGFLNVFVSYTAGYAIVPFDLISACCELVQYLDNLRERDQSLKSEKSGEDYSWTAVDLEKALSPEKMNTLKKYQRPLI